MRAIESASAAGKSIDEPGAANRFERVSRCDTERRGEVARRREIDEKCADKNGRPHAVTEHEQSGERNSRGRPDRRRTGIQKGELQAELARDKINDRDNADSVRKVEERRDCIAPTPLARVYLYGAPEPGQISILSKEVDAPRCGVRSAHALPAWQQRPRVISAANSIHPHVGILRFVAELRREFLISRMDIRDVAREKWIVGAASRWKRERQEFE